MLYAIAITLMIIYQAADYDKNGSLSQSNQCLKSKIKN